MLFNSLEFAIFFPIVFFIYWFILKNNLSLQNIFLLISSSIFYGLWDWRYLSLIFFSSLVNYILGLLLAKVKSIKKRKAILLISLLFNLGILGFFKYFNFFIESFVSAFSLWGFQFNYVTLNIILPLGISFYTFQNMGYIIDIYFEKIKPTKDLLLYFTFILFFPKLLAGPIERAKNLMPQLSKKREFNYEMAKDGLRQILWGLFLKIIIADNLAPHVDNIFSAYNNEKGSTLVLGAIYNSVQFYADFAGYSYIAIGLAKLLGISLMKNFAYPFFSKNITELWKKWHISLSTWLYDYVFNIFSLKYRYYGEYVVIPGIILTFLLCGLWHGANWTYIIWGTINGIYLSFELFFSTKFKSRKKSQKQQDNVSSTKKVFFKYKHFLFNFFIFLKVLFLFSLPMIFARSSDIHGALDYIKHIFSPSLFSVPNHRKLIFLVIFLFSWEWLKKEKEHPLVFTKLNTPGRWCIYTILVILILKNFEHTQKYIYFQF
jgi:alginate O-acetyltransferase complex protein AlgI